MRKNVIIVGVLVLLATSLVVVASAESKVKPPQMGDSCDTPREKCGKYIFCGGDHAFCRRDKQCASGPCSHWWYCYHDVGSSCRGDWICDSGSCVEGVCA